MAFQFAAEYASEVVERVRGFYQTLSEKDRRRYAAVEARRLGHGGVEYVARVLRCDPKTIWQGMKDLEEPQDAAAGRGRKKGGPQAS